MQKYVVTLFVGNQPLTQTLIDCVVNSVEPARQTLLGFKVFFGEGVFFQGVDVMHGTRAAWQHKGHHLKVGNGTVNVLLVGIVWVAVAKDMHGCPNGPTPFIKVVINSLILSGCWHFIYGQVETSKSH